VEWGYGGMGSVKTAAAVGADDRWSRVQGTSSFGAVGRSRDDDEDDGSGMAWLKKRREQREQERKEKEAEAKAKAAQAEKENHSDQQPRAEVVDSDPPGDTAKAEEAKVEEKQPSVPEPEHITTAVAVPAHHRPGHHAHSRSMERVPSSASHHLFKTPERRDSEDTTRAVSPHGPPTAVLADVEQVVGELDVEPGLERANTARGRRESESSTSTENSATEDEDADIEDSPKGSGGEDDEDESEDDVSSFVFDAYMHLQLLIEIIARNRRGGQQ
jgi:hypothetical protein